MTLGLSLTLACGEATTASGEAVLESPSGDTMTAASGEATAVSGWGADFSGSDGFSFRIEVLRKTR